MYKNGIRCYIFRAFCAVCAIVIAPIGTGIRASAQAPSTDTPFEVATIKPVDPSHRFDPNHYWAHLNPAGASYWSMTVAYLVEYAYGIDFNQVTGPGWATSDRFDIEAKFPDGADKKDDRRMLQALLQDRFKLAFHIEKRDLETYVLLIGKNGAKLKPSLADPVTPESAAPLKPEESNAGDATAKSKLNTNADGSSTANKGKRGTMTVKFNPETWIQHFELSKTTMEELAGKLSICLGRGAHKVVDETGVKGNYQIAFDCPMPRPQRPANTGTAGMLPSDPEDGSLLLRSLDALGLKLEKRKVLTDVYVIDHVEKPSAN